MIKCQWTKESVVSSLSIMEDPYEDSVIIVDPDSSTVTSHDPDYMAPVPKTKVMCIQDLRDQ